MLLSDSSPFTNANSIGELAVVAADHNQMDHMSNSTFTFSYGINRISLGEFLGVFP